MQLQALIEVWASESMVYIDELPGCVAAGPTAEVALERLPDAVEAHLGWLAANGFVLDDADIAIVISEQLTADDGRGPHFTADQAAIGDAELEQALRIAALARRDLIDVYRSVSALRRARRPSEHEWSIAEHLLHVARLDLQYLAALTGDDLDALAVALPADPAAALLASGAIVTQRLSALPDAEACVTAGNGECWTLRKVLRRMVGHQREHYPWVLELARR